jgi:putative flippase GtrA
VPDRPRFSRGSSGARHDATIETSTLSPPVAPQTTLVTRIARCMGVSVVSTPVSVTVLAATTLGFGLQAWLANVLATAVATLPSYHLNRRWTWGKHDASDLWREIMPFWVLSFAGLVLSTVAVALTDSWLHGVHLGQPFDTLLIITAHLSGFGILWVAQFILLDRILFVDRVPVAGSPR